MDISAAAQQTNHSGRASSNNQRLHQPAVGKRPISISILYNNAACLRLRNPNPKPPPPFVFLAGGGARRAPAPAFKRVAMAACLGSLTTGLLRPARPLGERIVHLTPMVSVVLAEDCYVRGQYGFPSAPMDLVPTGSPSLGDVLREAGKRFSASVFPDELSLALPSSLLEPLSLGTGHERLLKKLAVNPMFAIDCAADGGYLFSKDGASDNDEDCNGVEALIEAVKRKSRSLTRLIQEAEDKKRETDKRNNEDDENRKESEDKKKKEWEEKNREAEEIKQQLRRQARFWDKVTLRLLLVASRLKGKSNINEEEKTRLRKFVKTLLIFLKGPSTAKDALEAFENGAALWLLGGILLCVSCYLGEVDFWDIVEGRKMAIINKAERMLGVQAPPGKCFCGADLPILCAYCGEDLPHFLIRQGAGRSKGNVGDLPGTSSEGNASDLPETASEGNAGAVAEDK